MYTVYIEKCEGVFYIHNIYIRARLLYCVYLKTEKEIGEAISRQISKTCQRDKCKNPFLPLHVYIRVYMIHHTYTNMLHHIYILPKCWLRSGQSQDPSIFHFINYIKIRKYLTLCHRYTYYYII